MALTRTKKEEVLAALKAKLTTANSIGFTTNLGLTVEDVTNLRVSLREVNAEFHLVKKTFIKIAFKEVYDVEISDELLPNQIALVLSNEDAVAGMGKVNDFMKKGQPGAEKMSWTGSYFEGEVKNADDTKEIAGMPSRETLLSRMVGSLMSPLSGMARFLDAAAKEVEEQGKENLSQIEVKKDEKNED